MRQLRRCALHCPPREVLPKGDLPPHLEPLLPLGMTFPALSSHPPVASRRGAARGVAHVFTPSCLPFLFVLKAERGECCGSIPFKQNQQQQRKENCTSESISRFATSLGFCSNRRMILQAFSKGINPGFISLFLPIVTFFPSLRR